MYGLYGEARSLNYVGSNLAEKKRSRLKLFIELLVLKEKN